MGSDLDSFLFVVMVNSVFVMMTYLDSNVLKILNVIFK